MKPVYRLYGFKVKPKLEVQTMGQPLVKTMTRLPRDIRDFLAEDAKRNRRSMNSHMIAILEERKRSLEQQKAPGVATARGFDVMNPTTSKAGNTL